MKNRLSLGTARLNYPEKRFFSKLENINIKNLQRYDINRYKNKLLGNSSKPDYFFKSFLTDNIIDVDNFYMFNYLLDTKKNWALSFETLIPRIYSTYDIHRKNTPLNERKKDDSVCKYLELLSKENCLAINAISKASLKIHCDFLTPYEEYFDEIMKKTKILHPPQEIYLHERSTNNSEKLKLLFVGNDFHRKGGGEIIIAIDELIKEKVLDNGNLEVLLVGDFESKHNYALNEFQDDSEYFDKLSNIIEKHNCINVVKNIKNEDLLNIMAVSDIGLLPTWADTYGYSVLEMQSMSLPVISTNVRTLPEINFVKNVINIPVNSYGELIIKSDKDKEIFRRYIVDGIKSRVENYFFNRVLILEDAAQSINSLDSLNNPNIFREEINQLFLS